MTRFGDYLGGMRRNRDRDDAAEEALLSGIDDATSSAELVAFVNALRSQAINETPRPSPELLIVLTHGRSAERLFEVHAPGGTKAQRRSEALYGARSVRQRPRRLSRRATGVLLLAGSFGAFGVAGAAGALPNGIQRATSSIVRSLTPFTVPERNRWKKPPPIIVTPTPGKAGPSLSDSTEATVRPESGPTPGPTRINSPESSQGNATGGPTSSETSPPGPTPSSRSSEDNDQSPPFTSPSTRSSGDPRPEILVPSTAARTTATLRPPTTLGPTLAPTTEPNGPKPTTSNPGDTAPGRSNPKPTTPNPGDTAPGRSNPKPTTPNPSDTAPGASGPPASVESGNPSVTRPATPPTNAGQGNANGRGPKT